MTLRYTVTVGDRDRDVLAARLMAAGAHGLWDRDGELVAWFEHPRADVPPGGTWSEEPDRDWLVEWRRGLEPIRVGRLVVTTSWRPVDGEVRAGDPAAIVLDPGRAFGTGHHATTRSCLEELQRVDLTGARVLDVGTGTGILAIAADRLGASEVVAIDVDADAVAVARANVAANGAEVDVRHGGVDDLTDAELGFDVVVANILTDALVELAAPLVAAGAPGARVIVSGIGRERCHEVVLALLAAGATAPTVRAGPEWTVITART